MFVFTIRKGIIKSNEETSPFQRIELQRGLESIESVSQERTLLALLIQIPPSLKIIEEIENIRQHIVKELSH